MFLHAFVIADCMALLATAQGGVARATAANRPLDGVWSIIGSVLDGDTASVVQQRRLVWMPAHLALRTFSTKPKSDGSQVSEVGWRANCLVDAVVNSARGSSLPLPVPYA